MLYLLDANVLIDAARDYYPVDRVPEFWAWLEHQASAGRVRVPLEIYEEFSEGNDDLAKWAKSHTVREALLLDEEASPKLVTRVVQEGYAPDLDDSQLEAIGRDPFLIAAALVDPPNRTVVTTETSAARKQRQNRRVPDVCAAFDIVAVHSFQFLRALDFRTDWRP